MITETRIPATLLKPTVRILVPPLPLLLNETEEGQPSNTQAVTVTPAPD
jgi:hypothetical protein